MKPRRLVELELGMIIGRTWPQRWTVYQTEQETNDEIIEATRKEVLPWQFPPGAIRWRQRRIKQWVH